MACRSTESRKCRALDTGTTATTGPEAGAGVIVESVERVATWDGAEGALAPPRASAEDASVCVTVVTTNDGPSCDTADAGIVADDEDTLVELAPAVLTMVGALEATSLSKSASYSASSEVMVDCLLVG